MNVKRALVLAVCAAWLVACGGSQPQPCTPAVLAAIEARYSTHVMTMCQGFSLDTCPDAPALRAARDNEERAALCR